MSKQRKRGLILHCLHELAQVSTGAVSILLIIVTTPFLSLTCFLVESVRYQDVLEMIYELEDLASMSTLAHYDTFLHERFGLMAVDQSASVDERYNEYMNANITSFSNEIQLNNVKANGEFPLSETAVFEQQVTEYCEINGVVEVLYEFLDFDQIFEKLNGLIDTSDLEKAADAGDTLVKVLNALKEVVYDINGNPDPGEGETQMDSLQTLYDNFKKNKKDMNDKYPAFKEKFLKYCDALATARANPIEGKTPYEHSEVISAYNALKTPKENYKKAVKATMDSLDALTKRFKKTADDVGTLVTTINDNKTENETIKATINTINTFATTINNYFQTSSFQNDMTGDVTSLSDIISDIDKINGSNFSEIGWDDNKCASDFVEDCASITDNIMTVFTTQVKQVEGILNQKDGSSAISKYLKVFQKIQQISVFYNSGLNSKINKNDMAVYVNESFSEGQLISAISDFVGACEDFVTGAATLNFLKILRAAVKIITATVHLIGFLVGWIWELAQKIGDMVTAASSHSSGNFALGALDYYYEDLLITSYACYNFSNRTNYTKKANMSGYSYSYKDNEKVTQTFAGGWSALKDLCAGTDVTTTDVRFKGAELEYILCGLGSEIQNQTCAFIDVYLLRMAMDLAGVLTDTNLSSIASGCPPYSYVIYVLAILVEPFLDAFILANGGKVSFVKGQIYLSPKGIVQFIQDFNNTTAVAEAAAEAVGSSKKELEKSLKEAMDSAESTSGFDDPFFKTTYTENIMMLMLMKTPKTDKVKRMQNLVAMEAKYKDPNFDLKKAYTYVKADVDCSMKPMFNVGFANGGYIDASNTRYLGY